MERPAELRFGDLRLEGVSRAGDETWFRVHPPGLAFDVGRGHVKLAGSRDVFLTHGHLDHALGLPFVLSYRALHGGEATRVFCPADAAPAVEALVAAAERLEGATYRWEAVPLAAGDRVPVGRDLTVEAFEVDHPTAALGYHLLRRQARLRAELVGLPGPEIARRRAAGEPVERREDELWLTYAGDTGPGVFDSEPRLFTARILLLECTFVGAAHRERGRAFGHLHLDDLAARCDRFANQAVVLHHLSRRSTPAELVEAVRRALPELEGRVHVWGAGT